MDYVELMNDPHMRDLMRAKSRAYLTWNQFLDMPLPAEMGARRTWGVLQALFRNMGVGVIENSIQGHHVWYHLTAQLSNAAMRIFAECNQASEIAKTIERSSGRHFLSEMRIGDAIASAKLDGLAFSDEGVESMLRLGKPPVTGAEAYIKNCYELDGRLSQFVGQPFSRDLFWQLYKLVLGNAEAKDYPAPVAARNSFALVGVEPLSKEQADIFLDFLARYANNEGRDAADNDVFRAFIILESMQSAKPFGAFSTQVARMIFKLYVVANGLPVLAVLPLSKARYEWERGQIAPPAVACTNAEVASMLPYMVNERDVDLTLPQTIMAQLAILQIERVKAQIQTWSRRDEKVRRLLQHHASFNARQRSIIARAMRSPEATFTIRYHQNNHGISYATARHDLMELVNKGFLEMQTQGRAFVFTPSAELTSRIERHD